METEKSRNDTWFFKRKVTDNTNLQKKKNFFSAVKTEIGGFY
jgi:hypothetical protein